MTQRSRCDDTLSNFTPVGRRGYPLRRKHAVWYADTEWEAVREAACLHGKLPMVFIREVSLGTLRAREPRRAYAVPLGELEQRATALVQAAATARAIGTLPPAATLAAAVAEFMQAVGKAAMSRRTSDPTSILAPVSREGVRTTNIGGSR